MTIAMGQLLDRTITDYAAAGLPDRDPADAAELIALLRFLYAVGRHDLPLGRLFEGHVDAHQIVARYGTDAQRRSLASARAGVWAAGLPDEPLRLKDGRLTGGKAFASGAGVLTHALVTADSAEGSRLVLIDLARIVPDVDRTWWRTTGMQRSETHIVRWAEAKVPPGDLIGEPGDYAREPWFSSGALRFVAVHAGGVAALFSRTREHLLRAGRTDDPFQAARLAELFGLAEQAASIVRTAAGRWFDNDDGARIARTAATRLSVAEAGARALAVAQAAVGVQAAFVDHPLSATIADLSVYLRQPAPDAQRLKVGRAAAEGVLVPEL